jgi:hypothetical protein
MMIRDWNLTESPEEQTFLTYPYLILDHCRYPDDLRIPLEQLETYPRVRRLAILVVPLPRPLIVA